MKKLSVLFLVMGLIFVLTGIIYAGNINDPGIQARIDEQQKRIDDGIASGNLTSGEADVLQDNLNRLKLKESNLKTDGKLTPRERARLNRQLDRNNRMIYNKKHNPIRRF